MRTLAQRLADAKAKAARKAHQDRIADAKAKAERLMGEKAARCDCHPLATEDGIAHHADCATNR